MDKIIINIITNGKEDLDTYNYEDEGYCNCEDCCGCYDEDYEDEYDEYDDETTVEDELQELLQDTLEDIENGECSCDQCIYEKIMGMLLSAYYMGIEDAE